MNPLHRKPKIVVLGSLNMDLVIQCSHLPTPGETILADASAEFCGGKGANQAVAAALAGGDVAMIGAIGSDAFGERMIAGLSTHGIQCGHVTRAPSPSGLAVIAVDRRGENSILVVPNANDRLSMESLRAAEDLIASCDLLLVQLEIPMSIVVAAIEMATQHGVRVVLDPAPAPETFPARLLQVDLICPNESEASTLTGLPVTTKEESIVAAKRLHELGAKQVAITLGAAGTMLFDGNESRWVAPFSIDAIDTTAAGDAFAGALAVRWSEGASLVEAIGFANAAGALAASRRGAQASMAERKEIETLWRSQA